ncbi:MAG: GAF domain-containing protein [Stenomitos rutilans HA7619-LM2]|jgi:hypothetical protein|nr:GAF domain-containing protein [Stenomitos rutilans HA7619-LM2]
MVFSNRVSKLPPRSPQANQLHHITTSIRQSLQLQEILQATVVEVRRFLEVDRVMVYRFHPDEHGEVLAEAIQHQQLPSLKGLHFPADDIPSEARALFLKARQRSIVDLSAQQIGWSTSKAFEGSDSGLGSLSYRPVDVCHREYLKAMGVQASVVVPILQQEQLWGLLVAHHSKPRSVSEADLHFLQLVVDQVATAIAQANLLSQVQLQAQQESTANRIATLLYASTNPFGAALEAAVEAVGGSGGRLFLLPTHADPAGKLYTWGDQPTGASRVDDKPLEQGSLWQLHHHSEGVAIADLYQDPRCLALVKAFQNTQIRSLLILPLQQGQQTVGYLTLFRDEIDTERLWAGEFDSDERQRLPRQSFDLWREHKTKQAQGWTDTDLKLAQAIKSHFAPAVRQYVAILNDLANRKQAEVQLREQEQFFRTVYEGVEHIIAIIDVLAASEFHYVAWNPTAEKLADIPSAAIAGKTPEELFGETYGATVRQHYQQCVSAGTSVRYEEHLPFQKQDIWWLTTVNPIKDERGSIQRLVLTATIITERKQAEEALQQKAQQLAQAFQELQHTQAKLVQTEKMSSLGQLVAGVAHEINNPVNFISGNLNHASEYTSDLLNLLQLYQQHYPQPAAAIQTEAEAIDLDFLQADLPKLLTSMKVGVERIQTIVLALRNFSRMDEAEIKAVNIHDGIDSTLMILQSRLKATAGHSEIQVLKDYGDLPMVECYAGQLNQVFMNILSNAIDALDEYNRRRSPEEQRQKPATITIQTVVVVDHSKTEPSPSHEIHIRITDNGSGMIEPVRQRLFEPFFTTKPVGKGTGLGLSISYQVVVEKHGGNLSCLSAPGEGAEFLIALPLVARG